MTSVLVVGNPKPASRTTQAGEMLVEALTGSAPDSTIELSELGAGLLDWSSEAVNQAVKTVAEADLVVFASPTYKATYTGLLKLFLERYPGGTGLQGVVAVPLMLGGNQLHNLAADWSLRPVLTEIGATTALPGLYVVDSTFAEDGAIAAYGERWKSVVDSLVS